MFKSDLNLIAVNGRPDLWRYGASLVWDDIIVPRGFLTDLASIPHILDPLPNLDRMGVSRRAAGLHDWLYGGDRTRGKAFADLTLFNALLADGMGRVGAQEYFEAVHWFGQSSWDGDNTELRQEHFYTLDDWHAYVASLVGSLDT